MTTAAVPASGDGTLRLVTGAMALYAALAGGGTAVFLLSSTAAAPPQLTLGEIWSDVGPPSRPGWFAFLAAAVTGASAREVELKLRSGLSPGEASGIAWAAADGTVACRLPTKLGVDDRPVAAAETTLPTPLGSLALSFPAEAPLRGSRQGGLLTAIECGIPAAAVGLPAASPAAAVQIGGEAAGCVFFEALVGDPPGSAGAVSLMTISIDPLAPFDPKRSYRRFTGRTFGFARTADGWQLVVLEGDATE